MTVSTYFVNKQLADLRTEFGCSRQIMGGIIGVSEKTIARWEGNENHPGFLAREKVDELQVILKKMSGIIKKDKETEWLNTPNEDLGNKTPLEVMKDRNGIQEVKHLLGRLEWGIAT